MRFISLGRGRRRAGVGVGLPLLLVLVAVLAGSGLSEAGTLTGGTGLIEVPSADVLSQREAEIAVHYFDNRYGASVAFGAFDGVEIGVNNVRIGPAPTRIGVLIKGVVAQESAKSPGVAVGLETGESYVVASKRLLPRLRVHAGFGYGDMNGLFGGISYALTTTAVNSGGIGAAATTVLAEHTPNGNNLGFRMVVSPQFAFDIALRNLNEATATVSFRTSF